MPNIEKILDSISSSPISQKILADVKTDPSAIPKYVGSLSNEEVRNAIISIISQALNPQ